MTLSHNFIVFLVLTVAHLIKTLHAEDERPYIEPDFKYPIKGPKKEVLTIQPPDHTWSPPVSHHFFRFSNVGLQKIGRNFISSNDILDLSLNNNNINDISPFAFRNIRNLRRLNLSGNKIPKEKLLSLTGNSKLRTLIIDNNNDNSVTILNEYEVFDNLEHLYLRNSQLQNIQIPFYVATPILSHLYLSNNNINSSKFLFDNIPASLTHLYLDRNLIDRIEQEKFRYLQEVNMNDNLITQICFDKCEEHSISLRNAVRIQNLSLSRNLISEVSPDAFNDINQLLNLDLSGNKITEVAKDTFNNTFRIINLSIADNLLVTVPHVCPMAYLKSLNLSGNQIGGIFTNNFCHLRQLEYLHLSNNVITVIEARAFQLPSLKYLDLSGNRLKHLPTQWMYSRYIHELHFERNNFTNLDDLKLIDMGSLRNVYLHENPLLIFKVASFKLLPEYLMLHFKNTYVQKDQCKQCHCDDETDEDDEDSKEDN